MYSGLVLDLWGVYGEYVWAVCVFACGTVSVWVWLVYECGLGARSGVVGFVTKHDCD